MNNLKPLIKSINNLVNYLIKTNQISNLEEIEKILENINLNLNQITKLEKYSQIEKIIDKLNDTIHFKIKNNSLNPESKKQIILKYRELNKYFEQLISKNKKNNIKKGILTGTIATILAITSLFNSDKPTQTPDLTPSQIEKIIQIEDTINPNNIEQEMFNNSVWAQIKKSLTNQSKISKKFYDIQKVQMIKFIENYSDDTIFLQELINEKLYNSKTKTLTLNKVNPKLKQILNKLSLEENINPKIVYFIAIVESRFGKQNLSKSGALGVLQAMPSTMKENCSEYYHQLLSKNGIQKGEELFFNDLFIKIKAGIREIKKTQTAYSIELEPNSTPSAFDYIMLGANYNKGIGYFKRTPEKLNNKNLEVNGYVKRLLTLLFNVQNIE